MRRRRGLLVGAVVATLLVPGTAPALAVDDITPPVGTLAVIHDDRDAGLIRLSVPATDDASGVATVEVSGDGTTWASFPYAAEVDWAVFDPASGGAAALGNRTVRVRWTDGVGNVSAPVSTTLYLSRFGALEYPLEPVTGSPFTIRPIYGPAEAPPADSDCSWELRWGDDEALRFNNFNQTFGSIFTAGKPDRGFCGPWTFTMPWVPIRQFEVHFDSWVMATEDDTWALRAKFYPTVGTTDRRIRASNIPMVHILPDRDEIVIGERVTYTVYPIGVSLRSDDTWIAGCPNWDCHGQGIGIAYKIQYGGRTFSFTPPFAGHWFVSWSGRFRPFDVSAAYDPKVRRPDLYRPTTTAPRQHIGAGILGSAVPVHLEWSGSDRGWGLAKYVLQRSVDGGSWKTVGLPSARATSIIQQLATGHRYQYRVRAVDNYGNVGVWDYGPTFRPRLFGDSNTAASYGGSWSVESDPSAQGGALHWSDAAGAWAKLTFVGRDVAWIAERGPGKGRAKVYVDGVLRVTVDLAAGTDTARSIVYRKHWSTAGTHVIRIVVEGTLGRPIATLDAFAVLR